MPTFFLFLYSEKVEEASAITSKVTNDVNVYLFQAWHIILNKLLPFLRAAGIFHYMCQIPNEAIRSCNQVS